MDFVRYTEPQERFKFCKKIVQNKFCTPKFYQDLLKKVPFTSKQANSLNKIMIDKGENIDAENLLLHLCSDKCSEKDLKKFIKIADEAVKSKDKEKIGKISEILFSQDEQDVFALDNKIMTWLFTKGNIKDLDAVNNVRRFYGLQTDIGDYWHEDSDVVDARRILFSGNLSAIGEKNPHYARKHSAEFLKYKPDYSKEYSAEDYDLSHNISLKKLAQEGVAFPLDRIKECLAEAHVPPLLVNKFNITDFSHILIENSTSYIDDEMGKQLNLSEFQSDVSLSFREQFWQKVGKNDKLVKFISQDLENKGIMPGVIDQIWENVRESGSPCHNAQGYRNVFGVSLQLHHGKALKDGGKNKDDNIIIVVSIDGEKTILNDFDEERTRNIGLKDLNSHLPFHEFDNPLVNIYVDEKGNFSNKLLEKGKRIGVFTTPLPLGISGQSVLYYGGPNARSCCVGSVNGKVFDVDYDVTKKYSTIKNSKIPLKGIEHENF